LLSDMAEYINGMCGHRWRQLVARRR
jgi:hypothetical protein